MSLDKELNCSVNVIFLSGINLKLQKRSYGFSNQNLFLQYEDIYNILNKKTKLINIIIFR